MELNIFMRELESALVKRGIPAETARKHVLNLRRSFTPDDLTDIEKIRSSDEIEGLAESIAVILKKNAQSARPMPVPQQPKKNEVVKTPPQKIIVEPTKPSKKAPVVEDDDFFDYSPEQPSASTKGMLIFWIGLFLTLPVTVGLLAAIFGTFAAVFIGLAGLIVAGIAILIVLVAIGAGVSLVGIIFGITQLFSFVAAGVYEIGLGIMVAGAVLFASILIYNFSVRLVPWLITLVGNLCGFVARKLKSLFLVIRRECYKL